MIKLYYRTNNTNETQCFIINFVYLQSTYTFRTYTFVFDDVCRKRVYYTFVNMRVACVQDFMLGVIKSITFLNLLRNKWRHQF